MDPRLQAISEATHNINRNLLLLQGECNDVQTHLALDQAVTDINSFEANTMHDVRKQMELT
jgi:hypothetical protein